MKHVEKAKANGKYDEYKYKKVAIMQINRAKKKKALNNMGISSAK